MAACAALCQVYCQQQGLLKLHISQENCSCTEEFEAVQCSFQRMLYTLSASPAHLHPLSSLPVTCLFSLQPLLATPVPLSPPLLISPMPLSPPSLPPRAPLSPLITTPGRSLPPPVTPHAPMMPNKNAAPPTETA